MRIIKITPYGDGSRPPLQTFGGKTLPEGYAWCPEEFMSVFYSTSPAGFVNITIENGTVTEMSVNQEALDRYIANLPEPEPTPEPEPETETETSIYDELAAAYMEGVNSIDE